MVFDSIRPMGLALLILLGAISPVAYAETPIQFLRTHDMVYQSTDGDVKVVAVQGSAAVEGVFVRSGPPVDIQTFSPAELTDEENHTAFFRYDSTTNRYTEIISGSTTIKIVGNFTLDLGNARVAIDNANPYMTIAKGNGVLGLVATSVVINNDKAALLQANQFSAYSDIIVPYSLNKGSLTLKGKPVTSNVVGLTLDKPKHRCLKDAKPIYILRSALAEVQKIKEKGVRVATLNRIVKKNEAADLLKNVILIRIPADTKEPIIGINYQGAVQKISLLNTKSTEKTVCLIEDLSAG